jgi:dTDP-4-dehydrorhamnose reductase
VIGLARTEADYSCDVTDIAKLKDVLMRVQPSAIINSAALVDISKCEDDFRYAYAINARPASVLAEWGMRTGGKTVFISTDHFYSGRGAAAQSETDSISLLNEYARTKYLGEILANFDPNALVIRTNIVGFRRLSGRPTFVEWALNAIRTKKPLGLYEDMFSSPIYVNNLSNSIYDLIDLGASGIFNVASSEVSSKKQFVQALGSAIGIFPDWATDDSVLKATPRRAESLGLNVGKAETLLGYKLPTLDQTINSIISDAQKY